MIGDKKEKARAAGIFVNNKEGDDDTIHPETEANESDLDQSREIIHLGKPRAPGVKEEDLDK